MKLCLAQHPLSRDVNCLRSDGHDGEHRFGDAPGMATWNDSDTEWRYVPYVSQEQLERLHGMRPIAKLSRDELRQLYGGDE